MFALFVNDLALQIKKNNLGVCLDDTYLSILLYADDIILLAKSELDEVESESHFLLYCTNYDDLTGIS